MNVPANTIFVLGGIEGNNSLDLDNLRRALNIQLNAKEIKSKHIFRGTFSQCLKSNKLETYLDLASENGWHVHFQSLNLLYWAIVDIIDSLDSLRSSCFDKINAIKAVFYSLLKDRTLELTKIMHKYNYPNIKNSNDIRLFMNELVAISESTNLNHSLSPLKRELVNHLKAGAKQEEACFIQDEKPLKLLKDLSGFYKKKIYTWKNSNLIFDEESDIQKELSTTNILLDGEKLNNYSFVKSEDEPMIQMSDIAIGIVSKYLYAIDQLGINFHKEIETYDDNQMRIFKKLNNWLLASRKFNPVFFHQVTSVEYHGLLNTFIELYN